MRKKSRGSKRYAIYMRCSHDDQSHGDFTTNDVQQERNTKYVADKDGTFVKAYSDEGKTGTNLKRTGWCALLNDAQQGLFDVVVVTYMSRLARGNKYYVAEHLLENCGVTVERVNEDFTDDLAGHMNKEMTIFLDGMYPKQVSVWTRTKMEQMVAKGYFCGGTIPLGYHAIPVDGMSIHVTSGKEPPKRLEPIPAEADIVRHAYALYLEQRTLAAVRSYLLAVTDRNWVTTIVKNLLSNEKYIGVQQFGEWRNENAHEPIVDRDIFDLVQKGLGEFSPREANGDNDFTYYLRGRVRCPHCGCPYTQLSVNRASASRPKGRIHYYVCSKANKGKTKCPVTRINAEALHYTVLHEMERAVRHHTVMHKLIAQSGGWGSATEAQKAVRAQLAKQKQFLEVRAENYLKAIGEGRALDALLPALEKTEEEKKHVMAELAKADQQIAAATIKRPTAEQIQQVWAELVDLWDELTEEERATTLGSLVEYVEVKQKDRVALQFFAIAEVHGQMLALNSQLGAGAINSHTFNPRRVMVPLAVASGGRLRKRQPRPERQIRAAV